MALAKIYRLLNRQLSFWKNVSPWFDGKVSPFDLQHIRTGISADIFHRILEEAITVPFAA
jgi:hypothetical protein